MRSNTDWLVRAARRVRGRRVRRVYWWALKRAWREVMGGRVAMVALGVWTAVAVKEAWEWMN